MSIVQEGDLIQLVGRDHKYFICRLRAGGQLHTHRGVLEHSALIGQEFGVEVFSHLGHPFFLLIPSTDDLLRDLKRSSQIMYPKDIGLILMKMAIAPGRTVIEAGTGSGALTIVLAQAVGASGRVISYDLHADRQNLARKNLEQVGLTDNVTLKLRDIAAGFDETDVDALFLDLPNPWDYLPTVRSALRLGGFFGSILPTTNQVAELLIALRRNGFAFVEVAEVLVRYYQPLAERLRPADRMIGHTGFLIFGRPVTRAMLPEETEVVAADETPAEETAAE